MNKELEELRIIRQTIEDMLDSGMEMDGDIAISLKQRLGIIETALKRLEKIDNRDSIIGPIEEVPIDILSKKLKALEIIKEKEVNIQNFKNTCSTMSYEQYFFMWKDGCFMGIMLTSKTMLTQQEYILLKEVLL